MKKELAILISSLALSFVGCTQEQAVPSEEPVSEAESSAHESVEAEGVEGYSPYTRGYPQRVLEIPTPTWQAYDSKFYDVEMPDTVTMKSQERAYTSPIWYTP